MDAAWQFGARCIRALASILIVSSILAVEVAAIDSRDDEAVSAVVMTVRGETIEGRFIGATGTELTIETPSRRVALRLAEVSYVSFGGRPGAVSHALPNTPSSDLRVQGAVLESAGRLAARGESLEGRGGGESHERLDSVACRWVSGSDDRARCGSRRASCRRAQGTPSMGG
jgi:hypothetical protein